MTIFIPPGAKEQNLAIVGKNGSGKTTAAKAIHVEPLLADGRHICVVDPTSAWWGLRTSADGKGPGFKVLVLGGDHGDLPLPANGGAAVARLLVEQRVSMVLDTGNLTVGERTRWMIEFAGTVYRLNRQPLYLVLDEAHVFAPQGKVPDPDTGKMLHAVNQLAAGGRSRGIRLTTITQRPQKLHKDTLTTADTLIAMRVLAPQDREAIKAWIDGCGDPAQGKRVLESLAGLQRGEGWVWYPEGGFLERLQFPRIKTFDSSATPKDGQERAAPKGAADIDLTEIRAALADAVKEAEANDPKVLKARIAQLERESAAAKRISPEIHLKYTEADIATEYARGAAAGQEAERKRWAGVVPDLTQVIMTIVDANARADRLRQQLLAVADLPQIEASKPVPSAHFVKQVARIAPVSQPGPIGNSGKRRILIALAQHSDGLTGTKLSLLTGISQSGGTWRTYLGELRAQGLVLSGKPIKITPAGLSALGDYEPLPTGAALIDYWRGRLGNSGKRNIFDAVVAAYPRSVSYEEVSRQTGIAIQGGTWRTYLGELRGLELITGRGELTASEELFS